MRNRLLMILAVTLMFLSDVIAVAYLSTTRSPGQVFLAVMTVLFFIAITVVTTVKGIQE